MHRALSLLLPLLLLNSCAGPGSRGQSDLGNRPGPQGFRTVVIDAGHGGKDPGAVSRITGNREKDLTLDVARRVAGHLGGGFSVRFLRDGDEFIDLDDRVRRASACGEVLVSIHFNSGPSSLRGPETFYWRVDSYSLAKRLQQHLAAAIPGESGNRGLVRRRLRLTRNPSIPCVLVECGYLSNPAEARLCATPAYRDRLARAIADAIREQSARGDAGMGPLPSHIDAPPSRATDARE